MMKKSIKGNALLNALRTIISTSFPLITFPYISRVLQVENIGVFNFGNSVISYFSLIAALGISTYAIREGTQYREQRASISFFASEMFNINLVSALFSYFLLAICLVIITKLHDYRGILILLSVEIIFNTIGLEWIYSIYEDYKYIFIRSTIFQVLSLIMTFVLVKTEQDLYKYIVITIFSRAGANIFNFVYARQYIDIKIGMKFLKNWKKHLKPIFLLFLSSVAITIYVSSDITMLGFLTSDYTVGIYSTASKIYTIFKSIVNAVLVVTIPKFSVLATGLNNPSFKEMFSKTFHILTCLVLPASTGIICIRKEILLLLGGTKYIQSADDLGILGVASFFSFFAYLYSQCVLIPNKKEKELMLTTCISAIINIILNFFLIPILQDKAAALTTVIAEIVMLVMTYYFSKDIVNNVVNGKEILSEIIGCIGIILVCLVGRWNISILAFRMCLQIVLSVMLYIVVLHCLKNETYLNLRDYIIKRINETKFNIKKLMI